MEIARVFDLDGLDEVLCDLVKRTVQEETLLPTIILISQMAALLNGYFASHDKNVAHTVVAGIGFRLRQIARSLSSTPLILLPNSTTNINININTTVMESRQMCTDTLLSIFNTPPSTTAAAAALSEIRCPRPSFGRIFDQLVDMHLLCSRIPRTIADAVAVFDAQGRRRESIGSSVGVVWVVEVLRDGGGAWIGSGVDGDGHGHGHGAGERMFRHQRWGVVNVQDGVVVDAFATEE